MRKHLAILLMIVGFAQCAFAQQVITKPTEDPRRYIDTAVHYMEQEFYSQADDYFMQALKNIKLLSADFCFFFGKNSYYLKNYTQSIDWLNKYLELKGSRGQYSKEVLSLLEKAEEGFRQDRSSIAEVDVKKHFFYRNTIDCDDSELITCPVCKGDGIITTPDRLGQKYYTVCPYSTNGVLTCAEFNLLIQGKLKEKNQ